MCFSKGVGPWACVSQVLKDVHRDREVTAGHFNHFHWLKKYTVILCHGESLHRPQRRTVFTCACAHCACTRLSAVHTRGDREGALTDRTTSLIRMTGVLRAELDGRIQRLYNSSRNCEQEWMSTPARCFLQGCGTGASGRSPTSQTTNELKLL